MVNRELIPPTSQNQKSYQQTGPSLGRVDVQEYFFFYLLYVKYTGRV